MGNGTFRKHSITLIELLLVMTLIAIGLGALSWQVAKTLKYEQFERGVEQIFDQITLAQEIMLDFRTDVTLTLQQKNEEVQCQLDVNCPLPVHIEKGLNRVHTIKGMDTLCLNDQIYEKIEIQFEGVTGAISQGKLSFKYKERSISTALQGYPTIIKRGEHVIAHQEAAYPEEIFSPD